MVQVGSKLAPGIHLNAQLARRASVDVLGFAYYHAPLDTQAEAYTRLCQLAARGDIPLDYESVPLAQFEAAWRRQKSGSTTRWVIQP
jgi:NADPH2:quinone reductase